MRDAQIDSFGSTGQGPDGHSPHRRDKQPDSGSDEYGTPRWLIRKLTVNGQFDLDAAAGAEPIPIGKRRFTKEDDALSCSWAAPAIDSIYLNPPYSNPGPFLARLKQAVDPTDPDAADYGVALTKSDTSTGWFHDHLTAATVQCFLETRLSFHGASDDASFANTIAVFGEPPENLLETLTDIGQLYKQVEIDAALEQQRLDALIEDGGCVTTGVSVPLPQSGNFAQPRQHGSGDLSFAVVDIQDRIHIDFRTDATGQASAGVPESVSIRPILGGRQFDPSTRGITIDAVGTTATGEQVCVRIHESEDIIGTVETTVAVDLNNWTLATPIDVSIERTDTTLQYVD